MCEMQSFLFCVPVRCHFIIRCAYMNLFVINPAFFVFAYVHAVISMYVDIHVVLCVKWRVQFLLFTCFIYPWLLWRCLYGKPTDRAFMLYPDFEFLSFGNNINVDCYEINKKILWETNRYHLACVVHASFDMYVFALLRFVFYFWITY